jgi:hypothetical protein
VSSRRDTGEHGAETEEMLADFTISARSPYGMRPLALGRRIS